MSDAVVFAKWESARRLLARGGQTTLWQAAALGLVDRVELILANQSPPSDGEITNAFWHACRGGQRDAAALLLEHGADALWVGYDRRTPLDVAKESGVAGSSRLAREHPGRVEGQPGLGTALEHREQDECSKYERGGTERAEVPDRKGDYRLGESLCRVQGRGKSSAALRARTAFRIALPERPSPPALPRARVAPTLRFPPLRVHPEPHPRLRCGCPLQIHR